MPAMKQGGKRRLVIPSSLGYKSRDQQPLPAEEDQLRRLFSTVFNKERILREESAFGGDSITGRVVLDVELLRLKQQLP